MANRTTTGSSFRRRSLLTSATAAVALLAGAAVAAGPGEGAIGVGGGDGVVDNNGNAGLKAARVLKIPYGRATASYRVANADAKVSPADRFVMASKVGDNAPVVSGYTLHNRVVVRAADTTAAVEAVNAFGGGIQAELSIENLAGLQGITVFETASVADAAKLGLRLMGKPGVQSVEMETTNPREARGGGLPSDTLVGMQWHLENTAPPGGDHEVGSLFSMGLNGAGITVGVLEPGGTPFQVNHTELSENYDPNISMIVNPLEPNPPHGTSVAGLIAAKANGVGMVGVAPNVRLVALSNGSSVRETIAHQWKNGITHVKNNSWGPPSWSGGQVIPPTDITPGFFIPQNLNSGDLLPVFSQGLAIEAGSENGRAGRGTIFVWAAGNSGSGMSIDLLNTAPPDATNEIALPTGDFRYGALGIFNISAHPFTPQYPMSFILPYWPLATLGPRTEYDGYLNAQGTIAIAAVTEFGDPAYYTTTGTAVFAGAYSAPDFFWGQAGRPISTLYSIDDFGAFNPAIFTEGLGYTEFFGGTSAAAPIASGLISLILGANPRLTFRDVRHIIERTAIRTDFDGGLSYFRYGAMPTNSMWQANAAYTVDGRAVAHSDAIGFGLIDPVAAIELAQIWPGLPRQLVLERRRNEDNDEGLPLMIPDATLEESTVVEMEATAMPGDNININFCVPYDYVIEEVEVIITANGNSPGDLYIELLSPHGTVSPLHMPHIDNSSLDLDGQEAAFIENRFLSYKHWGEPSGGEWNLSFQDYRPNEEIEEGEIDDETMEVVDYITKFPMYGNIPTLPGNPDGDEIEIVEYVVRIYGYDIGMRNPNLCENRFNSFCPYDLDADGVVSVADLLMFVELWQNFEPVGDWDGNGAWDFNDIFLFYTGWVPGPCAFDEDGDPTTGNGGPIRPGDGSGDLRPI